jgi:hypothetical protein
MSQQGLFDDVNPTRATMDISMAWNNGPFDSAWVFISCHVGGREVFVHKWGVNHEEMDFSEVFHHVAREAQRLVLGHRVTNSHIRRGRVVYGSLGEDDIFNQVSDD